jgi:hypothetical protein
MLAGAANIYSTYQHPQPTFTELLISKSRRLIKHLDPNGSDDSVLRPGRVELPFLPGSGWLRQQGVLLVANPVDDQNTAVGLRGRLQSASSAELKADTHADSDGAYQSGDTTSTASTASSIDEPQSLPPSVVDGTDPTGSVSSRDSSSTELEKMRRQKRKATSTPDELPTRNQGRLRRIGSETVSSFVATKPDGLPTRTYGYLPRIGSETVSSSVTTKHSAENLYRSHCQEYQRTPSEATLQTIVDLLGAHGVEVGGLEASLLAFVQYVDFVWESDRIFVGSLKAEGAQRYERVWYKRVHRDGIYHGEFSVDADRQTCSLSIEHAKVEYFWPLFDTLFDMQDLARANNKQGDVYIAGTYLMLLQYPELRRFQKRSSGTGIQLEDRPEGFKRPFSPECPQSNAIPRAEQPSSSSDPISARSLRPTPSIQCRQSDGGARTLAEVLQEQETQRKITTMIQESARAYMADPEPTINFDASTRTPLTVASTPALPQQPQDEGIVGGVLEHLLQSVQVSSFANSTSHGLQLQMVASLPAYLFRPHPLELCPVVSSEMLPTLPSRDSIVRELETIAMGSSMPQQSAAHQIYVLPSQKRHLPAPVALMVRAPQKPSSSSITVDQARELLRRPRAKLISSGEDQDGGLQLFRFCINFPLTATPAEKVAIEFKFSAIISVGTSPVSLTKSQAFKALFEFAREDEESQRAI